MDPKAHTWPEGGVDVTDERVAEYEARLAEIDPYGELDSRVAWDAFHAWRGPLTERQAVWLDTWMEANEYPPALWHALGFIRWSGLGVNGPLYWPLPGDTVYDRITHVTRRVLAVRGPWLDAATMRPRAGWEFVVEWTYSSVAQFKQRKPKTWSPQLHNWRARWRRMNAGFPHCTRLFCPSPLFPGRDS